MRRVIDIFRRAPGLLGSLSAESIPNYSAFERRPRLSIFKRWRPNFSAIGLPFLLWIAILAVPPLRPTLLMIA